MAPPYPRARTRPGEPGPCLGFALGMNPLDRVAMPAALSAPRGHADAREACADAPEKSGTARDTPIRSRALTRLAAASETDA
jgi:hypothetical protein